MATEKAWYWAAVAVLVLAFGNSFMRHHQASSDCAVQRAFASVQQVSGRAMAFLSQAEARLGGSTGCSRPEMAAVRMQASVARMEASVARQQANFARLQSQRDRLVQLQDMRIDGLDELQNMRIEVPRVAVIHSGGTI